MSIEEYLKREGHVVVDVVPLVVRLVKEESLERGATVKEVDEGELVELPDKQIGLVRLEEHPTEAGEGCGHFQQHTDNCKEMCVAIVSTYTEAEQTERVVQRQE